jgi:hypothetical protein
VAYLSVTSLGERKRAKAAHELLIKIIPALFFGGVDCGYFLRMKPYPQSIIPQFI